MERKKILTFSMDRCGEFIRNVAMSGSGGKLVRMTYADGNAVESGTIIMKMQVDGINGIVRYTAENEAWELVENAESHEIIPTFDEQSQMEIV